MRPAPSVASRQLPQWGSILVAALAFIALLFGELSPAYAADLKFPALTGRVVDDAHILSADQQAQLTQKLAALEARTSRQLVVATVPSLQDDDIRDYGYQLGRTWAIGQKGLNNGAILLVAPSEHKVSIEVGYGLEPVLTDAFTSVVLNTQVLPKFKAGDMPGGIDAGVDALVQQMSADPSEAEQKIAAAKAQLADQDERPRYHYRHHTSLFSAILPIVFMVVVFGGLFGRGRRGGMGGLWPLLFLGGMMGGRDRDDDWGGGGCGGGGGFSGGGGSFGGGGSSGSW